ncbi:MAG: YmdB family metallophosphoesterase [Clostridia bacterium]|nr:YmdB family metallophosphoesterase [Clostridia bacterium]
MRILAVGDIYSVYGCECALKLIPKIKRQEHIDLVIANGENSALGNGITPESADMLFAAGVDVITGGNHSLRRKEIYDMLDESPFLLRPHNMVCDYGTGYRLIDLGRYSVAVINLLGHAFIERQETTNPFTAADELIERAKADGAKYIFVDFHAEATGEKKALGLYLDGRVSAIFGTHTHIPTADAQILPQGSGYITDLGFTGVENSVLGVKSSIIINRLKSGGCEKFEAAEGKCILNACIFDIGDNGLCTAVKQVIMREDANA